MEGKVLDGFRGKVSVGIGFSFCTSGFGGGKVLLGDRSGRKVFVGGKRWKMAIIHNVIFSPLFFRMRFLRARDGEGAVQVGHGG